MEAGAASTGVSARVVQGRTLKYSSKPSHHRPQMGYHLLGMVGHVALNGQDKKRLQAFMINLDGYEPRTHTRTQLPTIDRYRWCSFIDISGHKKFDFKVTSSAHKLQHNTRNASMVEWAQIQPGYESGLEDGELEEGAGDARLPSYYGEVQFFFTCHLPVELSLPSDIRVDSDDGTDTTLQALAMVRRFQVEKEDTGLLRKIKEGALVIIHVKWIRDLIGTVKVGKKEYIIRRARTLPAADI